MISPLANAVREMIVAQANEHLSLVYDGPVNRHIDAIMTKLSPLLHTADRLYAETTSFDDACQLDRVGLPDDIEKVFNCLPAYAKARAAIMKGAET